MRKPDFENLLAVLSRQKPSRPTLFEFFLNDRLHKHLGGSENIDINIIKMRAFLNAGYDYITVLGGFNFTSREKHKESSISLNECPLITDRESFKSYAWSDPDKADYSNFELVSKRLPDGMKIIGFGPGGVLENVIKLTGYNNLCMLLVDDPGLVKLIFDNVGSRLVRYYEIIGSFDKIGAMISNDDWGFKTQTMLSPADMRTYVIPWHRKIVETIHKTGRPAILHSCGKLDEVMEDIIFGLKYDAKHSYEDAICPVEQAYQKWSSKIAILGGIDVDFLCRSEITAIKERAKKMLELSSEKGAYALGSGNSIPEYVPDDKYLAMISVIKE